jgi:hypothetical protein
MGFENFTNLIQTVQPLTFLNLFEKKLELIWVILNNHMIEF